MKAGLQVALGTYLAMTVMLLLVWASAVGINYGWHPDQAMWVAVWSYHASLLGVIGAVAILGWLW